MKMDDEKLNRKKRSLDGRLILIVLLSSVFLSAMPAEKFIKRKLLIAESIRSIQQSRRQKIECNLTHSALKASVVDERA